MSIYFNRNNNLSVQSYHIKETSDTVRGSISIK